MTEVSSTTDNSVDTPPVETGKKRPKPGQRRIQILQTLAAMLEQPGAERVTTAALAKNLEVSEAALYRHFASKAQMFEGLLDFIEETVLSLINQIKAADPIDIDITGLSPEEVLLAGEAGLRQASRITFMMLQFAEKNPGMTRVMVGDALLGENDRLMDRMNLFFDKIESSLRQSFRFYVASKNPSNTQIEAQLRASVAISFILGRLQRFSRSEFKRLPTEHLEASLNIICAR